MLVQLCFCQRNPLRCCRSLLTQLSLRSQAAIPIKSQAMPAWVGLRRFCLLRLLVSVVFQNPGRKTGSFCARSKRHRAQNPLRDARCCRSAKTARDHHDETNLKPMQRLPNPINRATTLPLRTSEVVGYRNPWTRTKMLCCRERQERSRFRRRAAYASSHWRACQHAGNRCGNRGRW